MSRRASLPGASELFRLTSSPAAPALERPAVPAPAEPVAPPRKPGGGAEADQLARNAARSGSGRTKHDAKITVYVSGEELLAMEQARLNLRAKHELVVDRGRLVREAVAVLLADFDQRGEDSVLVQRLRANAEDGGTEG
ncbi:MULTISPECIES: cobyrinic acid a,c-diamide synthase [Amycolatopsis]|uniref:Cobyrinic acid a,c-diamide synthase n=1 Tax=Amycolatopsis dendrobii TaxID=2760662 RepID=A0A7W3W7G1_9PSEU|nr:MULTISPECIES: cobyrinic acid a,c-diamide synthase [Amycolatopsis]MBB1160261.1 cobyrinic acid a,c-diamide synthase [Amycolatopsis dendrobii]UKD58422.1 cobyrinic acid a,c-diamide synthase [Amycolatopsis sp. FU40]